MKNGLLLLAALFVALFPSLAQNAVSGIVVDAETKLPLQGASVFAQNTTLGAVTNAEGSFKLSLGKGGYEIVISFTGYVSQRMNVEAAENKSLQVELKKEDKSLSEVVITSSNEVADGWEKYGSFFIDHFVGATAVGDSCILQNPESLKFYYFKRSDKLRVLATEPLRLSNNTLGYTMQYALDSFVHYYKSGINSYRGSCFYTQMEGSEEQQQGWKEARKAVYAGSRLHFLRSYYDSTLKGEGFTVDMLSSSDKNKFNRLVNPYDSSYYFLDESTGDVELWFGAKVSITYNKQKPEKEYLEQMKLPLDVPAQISYVSLTDAIILKPNGYFIDQRSWINQGYWSWKNLADQLPYDYEPEGSGK
jgi:hypothetical protein